MELNIKEYLLKKFKKKPRRNNVVGIFEESEAHKSMTRVLSFMATTIACAIIIAQQIFHFINPLFAINLAAPSLLLGYSAGQKLTQKHFETRHKYSPTDSDSPSSKPSNDVVDDLTNGEFKIDREEILEEL